MFIKHKFLAFALIALLTLAVAACSSGESSSAPISEDREIVARETGSGFMADMALLRTRSLARLRLPPHSQLPPRLQLPPYNQPQHQPPRRRLTDQIPVRSAAVGHRPHPYRRQ